MRPFHAETMLRPSLLAPLALVTALAAGCGGTTAGDVNVTDPNGVGTATTQSTALAKDETPPPHQDPDEATFMRVGEFEREVAAAASAAPTATPVLPPERKVKDKQSLHPPSGGTPPKEAEVTKAEASHDPTASDSDKKPTLRAAVVDSSQGLSEADVRAAIAEKRASFRKCYDIGLKDAPDFAGSVSLRVTISPAGNVASVDVLSSSTKNQNVDVCVRDEVHKLMFKTTGSGAVVAFPLEFGK